MFLGSRYLRLHLLSRDIELEANIAVHLDRRPGWPSIILQSSSLPGRTHDFLFPAVPPSADNILPSWLESISMSGGKFIRVVIALLGKQEAACEYCGLAWLECAMIDLVRTS